MKKLFVLAALAGFFLSCNNKKTTETITPAGTDSTSDTIAKQTFFPVTSFLKGQLLTFDSLIVTPIHITTIHNKADSQFIKREQLKTYLQPFFSPEINDTNMLAFFKESKFNDQTVNAITLTYEPVKALPDSISIRTWNVYVNPETGFVTKVYMVKRFKENGQNIEQQLTWKAGYYALLTEIAKKPDGTSEIIKEEKFIWNFNQ